MANLQNADGELLKVFSQLAIHGVGLRSSASTYAGSAVVIVLVSLLSWSGCSGPAKEKEPTVAVDYAVVRQGTVRRIIETEAILFPLHQTTLVPKISAPVRKFLVNRGSHVRAGHLLAILENRDLVAGVQESRGAYAQAEATYTTTISSGVPEELQKAELDANAAKQNLDAQQ